MKFKLKNIVLVSLLAVAGFLGISSNLIGGLGYNNTQSVQEADAHAKGTLRFYLDTTSLSSWFTPYIKYSTDGGTNYTIVAMTSMGGTPSNVYYKDVPIQTNKIIFNHAQEKDANCNTVAMDITNKNYFKLTSQTTNINGTWQCYSPNNSYIYFTPSTKWAEASATFKAQFYDASSNYQNSVLMTKITTSLTGSFASNNTYYAKVNTPYCWKVQFLRMDSVGSEQWAYSSKFDCGGFMSWCEMNESRDSGGRNWNKWSASTDQSDANAHWSYLDLKVTPTALTPSNSTGRLFFYNSGSSWAGGGDVGTCAIRAWGGSASPTLASGENAKSSIYFMDWFKDDNDEWYAYVDIPTDITYFEFVLMNVTASNPTNAQYYNSVIWNTQYQTYIGTTYNVGGFFEKDSSTFNAVYYAGGSSGKQYITLSIGGAHNDVCGASLMKKVLASINTCYDNVYNGYKAYSNLNNYFYSHTSPSVKSTNATSRGGSSMPISTHMTAIENRNSYGISSGNMSLFSLFGTSEDNFSTIIIIVSSSVALLSVTALSILVIRKRKSKEID